MINRFIIRVYGIWISDEKILLVEETVKGRKITKFPGGGLEFGEGIIDCLKREFYEELGIEIYNIRHFYTTDFFVKSAFNPSEQVISIYYLVEAGKENIVEEEDLKFSWINLSQLNQNSVTLPIDRVVAGMLSDKPLFSKNL